MATYAIGDLQGCFTSLQALLKKIGFNRTRDHLWFVGDLVNRGPESLECLRFVRSLGDRACTVLGNHDLHLLAVSEGFGRQGKHDTLAAILSAPDRDELLHWLRHREFLHFEGEFMLVHAGLLPQWSLTLAVEMARSLEAMLRSPDYRRFLENMYGNEPDKWRDDLTEVDRRRIAINAMTRMRIVDAENRLDLKFKGELDDLPPGCSPWFDRRHPSFTNKTVIAGHWSALGLCIKPNFVGLDTGCVWGRALTALRLDDRTVFQVPCAEAVIAKGWD